MQFFESQNNDHAVDSTISARANGFLKHLESFEFFCLSTLTVEVFDKIQILNEELQRFDLYLTESHKKVDAVINFLDGVRESKFVIIWEKSTKGVVELEIDGPQLPRARTPPKCQENENSSLPHTFKSLEDFYRPVYYEIYDTVLMSLKKRFNTDTTAFLNELGGYSRL